MAPRAVEWAVTSGKWQRLHRGIIVMRSGDVDWLTLAGAALLVCGPEAALCGPSAAVIHRLLPIPSASGRPGSPIEPIHVVVSSRRRPRPHRGVLVTHSDAPRIIELWPWRTAYETTVVDLLADGSPDAMTALLATALRGRKTTVGRLRAEAEGRQRLRNRRLVRDLLTEASTGSRSRWSVASSTTSCAATAFPSVLDSGWWRRWATRATSVGSTGRSRHTALSSSWTAPSTTMALPWSRTGTRAIPWRDMAGCCCVSDGWTARAMSVPAPRKSPSPWNRGAGAVHSARAVPPARPSDGDLRRAEQTRTGLARPDSGSRNETHAPAWVSFPVKGSSTGP